MSNQHNIIPKHRCIETIAPKSDWYLRVDNRFINLNYLKNEDVWNRKMSQDSQVDDGRGTSVIYPEPAATERSLYKVIEEDPLRCFDYIQKECVSIPFLITRMATYLSSRALEIICNRIFIKQNVDDGFVELFYKLFFGSFLKKRYTWFSLHLLIKASKAYPVHFRKTLMLMLKGTHIQSIILQDYVNRLNKNESTNIMKLITELELTPHEFDHILPVIHILYKKSDITSNIFQYIQTKMESTGFFCAYNQNYGRLLLYIIKNLSGLTVSMRALKIIIDRHCTHYKNLCLAVIEQYVREIEEMQMNMDDGLRIVIPRPSESIGI